MALLGLFLLLVVPMLAGQVSSVVDKLPEHYRELRQGLIDSNNRFIQRLALGLPLTMAFSLSPAAAPAPTDNAALAAIGPALQVFGGLGRALFVIIAILVLAYYWVQEGEVLIRRVVLMFPAGAPRTGPRRSTASWKGRCRATSAARRSCAWPSGSWC